MGRRLINTIKAVVNTQPLNKQFLQAVMRGIEQKDASNARSGSNWYKPSGLNCIRSMWFTRMKAERDNRLVEYNAIGMADTGTRRHEAIQEALLFMNDNNFDWQYLDVAEYIAQKQEQGLCKNIIVKGKRGVETHLFDETLLTSFMCDGILLHKPTGEYYLFEFKNQISFKFRDKEAVDLEHHNQVVCYCTSLELNKALVLYENRDTTTLECPEVFSVTQEQKDTLAAFILECEGYVERLICPPKPKDVKCTWCSFKTECKKAGN